MKLGFWDRVLAVIYVLLTLALCVATGLRSLGLDLIGGFYEGLVSATGYWYLIYYGILAVIVLLGVFLLKLIFARGPKAVKFVTVDSGDGGKVVIAVSALEQMVRQAATRADGVSEMQIGVHGEDDAISVLVELTVQGGVHLPTVTTNLQNDIRHYVQTNCGVAVRNVTVTVGAVLPPQEFDVAPGIATEPSPVQAQASLWTAAEQAGAQADLPVEERPVVSDVPQEEIPETAAEADSDSWDAEGEPAGDESDPETPQAEAEDGEPAQEE